MNWIKSGLMTAQRTAGGQYRIRVDDLRNFMASRGMSTEVLEQEHGLRPPCWQFHARGKKKGAATVRQACRDCVVYHLGALHCYKLMAMQPADTTRDCARCTYFQRWADEPSDIRWTVGEPASLEKP